MRPQQQNRRMRGRNNNNNSNNSNNNRKGPHPLSRNYESNGPDVKIRGSAQQIAEKYATLARDATSSGDRVMAENYLQHAEHYNRIIAAAQAQMPIQNFQQNRDDFDDEDGEERGEAQVQGNDGEQPQPTGDGPQPVIEGMPAEVALNGDAGGENQNRNRDSYRNRDGRDRDRNRNFDRNGGGNRNDYQRRDNRRDEPQAAQSADAGEATVDALPSFLTAAPPSAVAEARPDEAAPRSRRPRRGEGRRERASQEDIGEASDTASDEKLTPAEG